MVEFSKPRRRRKHGQAPTVSDRPPNADWNAPIKGPSMGFMPEQQRAATSESGRVIAVFGPPGSGVSTILKLLTESSSQRLAVLQPEIGDLAAQARDLQGDAVLVDGFPTLGKFEDGSISGPDAVQYLYDQRLVFPGTGAVIRVIADPEICMRLGRATEGALRTWFENLPAVEQHIQRLNLPYFNIHNTPGEEGLMQAVGDFARRAGVSR